MSEVATKPLVVITGKQQKEIQSLVSVVKETVLVESREQFEAVGQELIVLADNLKQLDKMRTSITGPLNTAITKLNEFFGAPKRKLENGIQVRKAAMQTFLAKEKAIRDAAQKQLDDAAAAERKRIKDLADKAAAKAAAEAAAARKKGDAERAAKIEAQASVRADIATAKIDSLEMPVVDVPRVSSAGVGTRRTWVAEEVDINQIPRKYLKVDQKSIDAAVAAGERFIPGVKIYERESIVIAPRKVS